MKRHALKITAGALIAFAIACAYASARFYMDSRRARAGLNQQAALHAQTLGDLKNSGDRVAYLEGHLKNINAERESLKKRLNDYSRTAAELETRPGPPAKIIVKKIPADCESCIGRWRLPLSTDNQYRKCWTADAFSEPLQVEIKDAYDAEIVGPYADLIDAAKAELATSEKYHPVRLDAEAVAGLGLNGQFAMASVFVETGKKWRPAIGVGVPIMIDPMGETRVNPSAMFKITGSWP